MNLILCWGFEVVRLGITMPEITRMQIRAIFEAACEVAKEGKKIVPEIMIPSGRVWRRK